MQGHGTHRLDLPMTGIQLLDGAATHQLRVLPDTPKCNVRVAQRLETESMNALGGRMQRHTPQVLVQQTDNLRAAQVIYANIHMTCLCFCWHLAKQAPRRRAMDRIRTGRGEQCRQYEQAPSCTRRNARSPGCHGRYQKEVIEVKDRIPQAYSDLAAGRKNGEGPEGRVGRHIQSPK